MKQNYQYCLTNLLKDEGGYSNNPNDAGGPTNFGITIADYRMYINPKGTATDVKNMSVEQAKLIYKSKYWNKVDGDNLPSGVDYAIFDYAVHSGVSRALRINKKFENYEDAGARVNAICDERLSFLKSIRGGSDWQHFGRGWSSRVLNVRNKSIKLARTPSGGSTKATGALIGAAGTGVAGTAVHHWWDFLANNWYWITGGIFVASLVGYIAYTIYEFNKKAK